MGYSRIDPRKDLRINSGLLSSLRPYEFPTSLLIQLHPSQSPHDIWTSLSVPSWSDFRISTMNETKNKILVLSVVSQKKKLEYK